ncbi:hypothetical protein BJ875DRAFT_458578 [Amylocarpus encephaloides]|uniref:ADP-ribosylation factor n=1 Tax=Amylocarpus encephaloides TaxID=45428 RepID=A0A9P7YMA3_9HELO|nr:hypothetical protein BJ875DRAFT_458578 [Amylocarpus encephaloides]
MSPLASPLFQDYDDDKVFHDAQERARDEASRNFVIEFGKDEAQIAFDLGEQDFNSLLNTPRTPTLPIRWINIWGPHLQPEVADCLGKQYDFSKRLRAIIKTKPIPEGDRPPGRERKHRFDKFTDFIPHKERDLEKGRPSGDIARDAKIAAMMHGPSHYTIVNQMVNYHAMDFSNKFICVGANWMHERKTQQRSPAVMATNEIEDEGKQRRLYSWLVLCHDHTVISFHEDPGTDNSPDDLGLVRANLLSVFSQVSNQVGDSFNPISMQTVRDALSLVSQNDWGLEGSSNLFYYLFDDWRAAYQTVGGFSLKLSELRTYILQNATKKSVDTIELDVIPRLHVLGTRIREMEHVYEGYKNLIQRILEPPRKHYLQSASPTSANFISRRGPPLAPSAVSRFERLGDRLQLLILSEIKEFLAEKDALTNTYFNINAQKDSEATARLTRAAGLLAKLSVLFLPVSLMTSYFSIQIAELEGVYTTKDYWYSFAVIMGVSFLFLFFFARLLMWITETFEASWKKFEMSILNIKLRKKNPAKES